MKIVFTNGKYDCVHVGHVRMLKFAKSLGDRLIVGVNSDASYREVAGRDPVMPCEERCEIIRAIKWVDEVIPFDEITPESLIRGLNPCPHILVKGPERRAEISALPEDEWNSIIPGYDHIVRDNGGQLVFPPWVKEHSSSKFKGFNG